MLHVGFRVMHESMTSQKIKKLGAGGPSLVGGPKLLVGGMAPGPPAGYGPAFRAGRETPLPHTPTHLLGAYIFGALGASILGASILAPSALLPAAPYLQIVDSPLQSRGGGRGTTILIPV